MLYIISNGNCPIGAKKEIKMALSDPIYVKLFEDDYKKLKEISEDKKIKISYLIRKIVNKYIDQHEEEFEFIW